MFWQSQKIVRRGGVGGLIGTTNTYIVKALRYQGRVED